MNKAKSVWENYQVKFGSPTTCRIGGENHFKAKPREYELTYSNCRGSNLSFKFSKYGQDICFGAISLGINKFNGLDQADGKKGEQLWD